MTTLILAGVGIVGTAVVLRVLVGSMKQMQKQASRLPKSSIFTTYYKGGFDPKMSRREAGLILGVSPSSSKDKIKEVHKRIMLLNHPDKGGSPYLAAKINEAKDYLEK